MHVCKPDRTPKADLGAQMSDINQGPIPLHSESLEDNGTLHPFRVHFVLKAEPLSRVQLQSTHDSRPSRGSSPKEEASQSFGTPLTEFRVMMALGLKRSCFVL